MCDCCVQDVDTVCEIYFGFYLLLMLLTVIALLNLTNLRKKRRLPRLIRKNSTKFWVYIGSFALQISRLAYFSTAYFKDYLTDNQIRSTKCAEMWLIEVPAWLEFTNIALVHDFLMRLYLVIHDQ